MSVIAPRTEFTDSPPIATFASDAARWAAVTRRDPRAAGAFLYAVRTTGVYCRPACASRLPRRENVSFFETPLEAECAGFRACKRCAPQHPAAPDPHAAAIARACRRLEESDAPPTLAALAAEAGLSPFHFQRVFKRATGLSPKQYAIAQRERRLRERLTTGTTVTDALYDAGYGSASRAYDDAPATLGMTPGAYRGGAPGEVVRYGLAPCALGRVLVASTARGVCAIELGESDSALAARLAQRYPRARLEHDADAVAPALRAVTVLIDSPRTASAVDLPLDVRGTAFQRRVWEALRAIPVGTTVTYGALAARLGRPTAARAVAQACGANALAVAIPCHRVVGAGGDLGGYRWGLERKRALLAAETAT